MISQKEILERSSERNRNDYGGSWTDLWGKSEKVAVVHLYSSAKWLMGNVMITYNELKPVYAKERGITSVLYDESE